MSSVSPAVRSTNRPVAMSIDGRRTVSAPLAASSMCTDAVPAVDVPSRMTIDATAGVPELSCTE